MQPAERRPARLQRWVVESHIAMVDNFGRHPWLPRASRSERQHSQSARVVVNGLGFCLVSARFCEAIDERLGLACGQYMALLVTGSLLSSAVAGFLVVITQLALALVATRLGGGTLGAPSVLGPGLLVGIVLQSLVAEAVSQVTTLLLIGRVRRIISVDVNEPLPSVKDYTLVPPSLHLTPPRCDRGAPQVMNKESAALHVLEEKVRVLIGQHGSSSR